MYARLFHSRFNATLSPITSVRGAKELLNPHKLVAMPDEDQQEINRKSGIAYAAAISLFAAVVGGLIIGWLLDRWLGTRPWLLVAGVILGAAAGFYEFIRAASKL